MSLHLLDSVVEKLDLFTKNFVLKLELVDLSFFFGEELFIGIDIALYALLGL